MKTPSKQLSDKLTSMKLAKTSRMHSMPTEAVMSDRPEYPYGLNISLENDSLDKLSMKSLPDVGDEMTLIAKVKVVSVSSNESESGERRSISLQITDMDLE